MVFSNCRHLKLSVRSLYYDYQRTFRIPFTVLANDEECGKTSFTGPSGTITSPRFPLTYPHSLNCIYSIDVGRRKTISLDFLSFDLQGSFLYYGYITNTCVNDWLTISCSSEVSTGSDPSPGTKYCGLKTRRSLQLSFSNCPAMRLNFVTDSSVARGGFRLQYIINETGEECGNTSFTGPTGVITSPKYPLTYPHGLNCTYSIEVDRTKTISFDFLSFELEGSIYSSMTEICNHDWLTISCSSGANPSPSRKYCGLKTNPLQLSLSNCSEIRLNFVTDSSVARGGFRIRYIIKETGYSNGECGNTSFTGTTGFITSPKFPLTYPHGLNCVYSIDVGLVETFSLLFLSFHLEGTSNTYSPDNCPHDWLTVSCSPQGSTGVGASSNRKYCGHKTTPFKFPFTFSNCSVMRLNFVTDSTVSYGGFRIQYNIKQTDEECGNTSFTGRTGVITSPKFPLTYPHGLNCVYSINVGLMETISLIFLAFQLEGTSNTYSPDNCNHDWLTISCSSGGSAAANSSSSRKYCGLKTTPLKFSFSNCSAVKLNFVTDSSVSSGGFRIKYQISPPPDSVCGASIHNRPSGVMSPPLNYTDYWDGFDCNYFINSTEQSSISLTIWSISLQRSNGGNCQSEWLLITCIDGLNELDHKVTHKSCHFLNSSTVLTFPRCATVQVVVHKDPEVTGKSFRIEYLVNGYGTAEAELPTTSALTTRDTLETRSICVTGCAISADGTYCECMTTPSSTTQFATKPVTKSITVRTTPGTGQSDTTVVSSEIPNTVPTTPGTVQSVTTVVSSDVPKTVPTKTGTIQFEATTASSNVAITVRTTPGTVQSDTTITSSDMSVSQTAKCDIRCSEMSADDRSSCSCTSTKPDELVVKTQMSSIAGLGYSVLIPIAVIVIVILSIFVVTLWIRGRLRSRDGQEILLQEMEEDVSHLGAENGNATTIENKMYDSKGVHD